MSNPIKDGGPAFPAQPIETIPGVGSIVKNQGGMTLRDYFAGQALAGMLACPNNIKFADTGHDTLTDGFSVCAYELADQMLAAKEAKP